MTPEFTRARAAADDMGLNFESVLRKLALSATALVECHKCGWWAFIPEESLDHMLEFHETIAHGVFKTSTIRDAGGVITDLFERAETLNDIRSSGEYENWREDYDPLEEIFQAYCAADVDLVMALHRDSRITPIEGEMIVDKPRPVTINSLHVGDTIPSFKPRNKTVRKKK